MAKGHGELLIITTIDHAHKAEAFSRGLVEQRLAVCVTRLPGASSMYRWESNEVTDNAEIVLLIKTHHARLTEVEKYFAEAHPYTVPEILVFEIDEIGEAYRAWLTKEIGL
ncbi:MAG: divalent-cation tolerance protein CutA [Calditrichaeota bacterium]|nr:divalent-cation tolerance protein CutA [Calditrichota bacterium]